VPYDRAADVARLAIRMQGSGRGLTLDDIQREFEISRRNAERLRDAVEEMFGPLETVPTGEPKRRCRLRAPILRRLISLSAEELAELSAAADALDRTGLEERAVMLRRLDDKLRALLEAEALNGIEPDLQALTEAEGLAMRPGPRPRLEDGLLALLRQAVKTGRVVAFDYASRATGQRTRRRAEPYGLIYGNRAFLIGRTERDAEMRLWRLARMSATELTGDPFERDPTFDLHRFSRRSFGTFQEEPVAVVLRFTASVAEDVAEFVFHPDQTVEPNDDGSLTVRFTAGGIEEMSWHLVTWGTAVTVEQPVRLRRRLREMCATLASHHGAAS
jgi:predicted DNA-binding transcriptional regulator YafY